MIQSMHTTFYNIPKIPKIPIFVADKDDIIVYRNDTARVRFPEENPGTSILNLIDESDMTRYKSLVGGYAGLDRKGILRLNIGSKRETAIFEQHTADNVILRAFMLLSGDYALLKKLYNTISLEPYITEETLNALYHITEDTPAENASTDALADMYAQVFSAKLLICSCFGYTKMKRSLIKMPYRFIGFIDFWVTYMIPKIRLIDCDVTAEFASSVKSSDYASINPCGLLVMMTALASYLGEFSLDRKICLQASKRSKTYNIDISTHVDLSVIAQYNSRICSLAELMPDGCLNLVLASSISKQCGFNLSYSIEGAELKRLVFHFTINDSDIGTLGFKANHADQFDSIYIDAAQILF